MTLRYHLLIILLSLFSLSLLTSCKTATTPESSEEEEQQPEETVDPTVSISGLNEGALLKGIVEFSVDGEAQDGFDEARVYVGEELVETVENPELPLVQSLTTYNFNNGSYDVGVELDVSGEEETISASVSVTLENFMVEMETDGYIAALNEQTEAAYLFIADPEGNVLHSMELMGETDGVMNLLPPGELEGGAPESYTYTLGRITINEQGRTFFMLYTDVGLQPWTKITLNRAEALSPQAPQRELEIELTNFPQPPLFTRFQTTEFINTDNVFYHNTHMRNDGGKIVEYVSVPEGVDDMVITHTPDMDHPDVTGQAVPSYRWEKDLTQLPSQLSYNVSNDFTPMVSHTVDMPSNIDINIYAYFMTIAPDSYAKGDVDFTYWNVDAGEVNDANGNDPGFGIWVPEITERSFMTYFAARDKNDPNVRYRHQTGIGGFPDKFTPVTAEADIVNSSLDNLQLNPSGSFDVLRISAVATTANYHHQWNVSLPDDAESFVFPRIKEHLDVAGYNRSNFDIVSWAISEYSSYEGYSDYLEAQYGTKDFGTVVEWNQKLRSIPVGQAKINSNSMLKENIHTDPLRSF